MYFWGKKERMQSDLSNTLSSHEAQYDGKTYF